MHTHHFYLAYNLPLGIPDTAGWTPMLLVRACRECLYAEAFHGSQWQSGQRNRLHAWEVWVDDHLDSHGETFKWKRAPRRAEPMTQED